MGPRASRQCPLCTRLTSIAQGTIEPRLLIQCRHCGAFVIDTKLVEVIANARIRQLATVLARLPLLSDACRAAGQQGGIVTLTATNWIGVAETQSRRASADRTASWSPADLETVGPAMSIG